MKKIPMRRCVATQTQAPKKDLLRIVRSPEGVVSIDTSGKSNGRGAYLLKTEEALDTALKRGSLNKALECEVPTQVYDAIREVIRGKH